MSRRQRRSRAQSLRQQVVRRKALRRRARLTGTRPSVATATAAALVLAGAGAGVGAGTGPAAGAPSVAGAEQAAARCGSPRTPGSHPDDLVGLGGRVLFAANDGVHDGELWRSDGTRDGTVRLTNLTESSSEYDEYTYGPQDLTVAGGRLFFTADDASHGNEVLVSDGTRRGTGLLKDLRPGQRSSYPSRLTAVGDDLFFVARTAAGNGLWTSDGTSEGTVRLKDLELDEYDYGANLVGVGDRLFFGAPDEAGEPALWTSDGTRAGTVVVSDVEPYQGDYGPSMVGVGDTLFFVADDGTHGRELWRSDGTEAGTALVKDIRPGSYDSDAYDLTPVGDSLFLTARDGVHGAELWTSDGTEEGTTLVEDIDPDARGRRPVELTAVGDTLYFNADAGTPGRERALWRSDGTEAGTTLVEEFADDGDYGGYGPQSLTDVAGTLFFTAPGTVSQALWRSDGTEAGTVLVKEPDPTENEYDYDYGPENLTAVGTRLYFAADNGTKGQELWRSDGTTATTRMVGDVNQGGGFEVARRVETDPRAGTARLRVGTEGAGDLVVRSRSGLVRTVRVHRDRRGVSEVRLVPTAEGMRRLEQARREARREGKQVGRLAVRVRVTFTPCGGEPSSQVRRVVLELR